MHFGRPIRLWCWLPCTTTSTACGRRIGSARYRWRECPIGMTVSSATIIWCARGAAGCWTLIWVISPHSWSKRLEFLPAFLSVRVPIEADNPSIVRWEEKCIRCGMCKEACTNLMGVHGTYTLEQTGGKAICIYCGQCANVCPVDSITERDECSQVQTAIADPNKVVVVSTSPSVRAALGEEFGMEPGAFVEGKMVALLRALGVDYVLDTNFAADLTIVEEASELLRRIKEQDRPLPQFTSCCPGWVHFAEIYAPELLPHLSTAKSPIGMQGPTVKTYFARQMGLDPRQIVHVALTPCTAKKFEIRREEMHAAADYHGVEGMRDTDQVITTRELARWARAAGIDWNTLEDSAYRALLHNVETAQVFEKSEVKVWECRNCGHIVVGTAAPEVCPTCLYARSFFEIHSDNY